MTSFSQVAHLDVTLDREDFRSGDGSIDAWLRDRAIRNERAGASRTYVTLDGDARIAGFYSLSTFTVARAEAKTIGKGMPDPVPAMLIGKLAVHERHQGGGLGASLLLDALARCTRAAAEIGAAAIVVHAAHDGVVAFYERFGFSSIAGQRLTLAVSLASAEAALSDAGSA